jgi:hypothetical protein
MAAIASVERSPPSIGLTMERGERRREFGEESA